MPSHSCSRLCIATRVGFLHAIAGFFYCIDVRKLKFCISKAWCTGRYTFDDSFLKSKGHFIYPVWAGIPWNIMGRHSETSPSSVAVSSAALSDVSCSASGAFFILASLELAHLSTNTWMTPAPGTASSMPSMPPK